MAAATEGAVRSIVPACADVAPAVLVLATRRSAPAGVVAGYMVTRRRPAHLGLYSESLERLILVANAVALVESTRVPVRFVIGTDDPVPDPEPLERLAGQSEHVSLAVWPDYDHDLLLTAPRLAVRELRSAIAALLVAA